MAQTQVNSTENILEQKAYDLHNRTCDTKLTTANSSKNTRVQSRHGPASFEHVYQPRYGVPSTNISSQQNILNSNAISKSNSCSQFVSKD